VTDANNVVTTFAYDVDDRLSSATMSSGRQVAYSYDALSRITTITDTVSGPLDPSITVNLGAVLREARSYTPNGRLAASQDGYNHVTSFSYDGFDRLAQTLYADTR
jgi:YD repeat-containing protein